MENFDSEISSIDEETASCLVNSNSDKPSENSFQDDIADTRSELKFERGK